MDSYWTIIASLVSAEILVLASVAYLDRSVRKKQPRDDFNLARMYLVTKQVYTMALGGLAFAPVILVCSLFETGEKASLARAMSPTGFLILGWVGIFQGGWVYFKMGKMRPKEPL